MVKSIKKQKGFTLIELMVVIVIIGILVAIALPNFIGAQDRAKISSVKANMHTLQTVAETYAVDWGGVYPGTVSSMSSEAKVAGKEYWKDFINPFTGVSGPGASGSFIDETYNTPLTGSSNAGLVGYTVPPGTPITTYAIYGHDKSGARISNKGKDFFLTNS